MSQPSIYQLRIVLRDVSPLIWRRLLVRSDTTLAHLHTILQIVFAWSDEHLHRFQIHGKAYGHSGALTHRVLLSDLHLHRGERFQYVYDFIAHWACDLRLEAILPLTPRRVYPICITGKYAAPPQECRGAWAYMERLDQHRLSPPLEAMGVMADAISTLLGPTEGTLRCEPVRTSLHRKGAHGHFIFLSHLRQCQRSIDRETLLDRMTA
jgi:Plasmid pRiA4b ORF-3-like protein